MKRNLYVVLLLIVCSNTVDAMTWDELTTSFNTLIGFKDSVYENMQMKFEKYCIDPMTVIILFFVTSIFFALYTETVVKMGGSSLWAGGVLSVLFIIWLLYVIWITGNYMLGYCT